MMWDGREALKLFRFSFFLRTLILNLFLYKKVDSRVKNDYYYQREE